MKIHQTEQEIIRSFVVKRRQERLLWELGSPKKREKFFWNLAGTRELNADCLEPFEFVSTAHLEETLRRLGGTRSVYYIGASFIGETSLKEALAHAEQGDICLIYCGNGVGYHQGEFDTGRRPRHLLRAKSN